MRETFKAGVLYFALVFAARFALGTISTVCVGPLVWPFRPSSVVADPNNWATPLDCPRVLRGPSPEGEGTRSPALERNPAATELAQWSCA